MCAGPFRPSKPPPPPADEIGREKRVRERAAAQREKAELKQKFQNRPMGGFGTFLKEAQN